MKKLRKALKLFHFGVGILFFTSCGNDVKEVVVYDPATGKGNFEKFSLKGDELDSALVSKGDEFYMSKCSSCHLLTAEDSNGPGWRGITSKRSFGWLMNMMTNTEEMLELDPTLNGKIKKYKVTMPDYQLNKDEARAILEFMRFNDSGKNNKERKLPEQCHFTNRKK